MKRDIFLIQNYLRLDEFVAAELRDNHNSLLGIGFYFSARASQPFSGIELCVSPPHLKQSLLAHIEQGQFSPLEEDVFFVAGSDAGGTIPWYKAKSEGGESPLTSWLLVGLSSAHARGTSKSEEHVQEAVSRAFKKVLELRPSTAVFLLDTDLLARYFADLRLQISTHDVLSEVMNWLVEECVHPRVALVCKSSADCDYLLSHSKKLVLESPLSENVQFHI